MTWGGEILDKHIEHVEVRGWRRLWLKLHRRPTWTDVTVIDRIRLDWVALDGDHNGGDSYNGPLTQYVGQYHGHSVYVDPSELTPVAAMCPTTRIIRPLRPTDGGGF